jgi:hypothetical protein
MRSLGRWITGFVTTCIVGFAAFAAFHVLRYYLGLTWTVISVVLLALLVLIAMALRIAWLVGKHASGEVTARSDQ